MKNWLDKYIPQAQNGIEGTMSGLTDKGFNYNGAWGGQFQMGGLIKPSQKNYKTKGEYNAALKTYNLNLRKYNLNNNPERLKNESEKDYETRTKYFNFKTKQEENKYPVSKAYLEMKDSQNADINPVTKTLRQIFTSPVHVAYGIYNSANPHNLDKYKSRAVKNEEDIDLVNSSLDAASLLVPFDYGMKSIPLWKQAAKRTAKEVAEDEGFNLLKEGNRFINNYQTGGAIPGSVGFTYARTKGIPSEGPYAKKTMPSAQNGVDMYDNPIIAKENYIKGAGRSNYNPRTNISNLYDLDPRYDQTRAHENYHAIQFAEGRSNFDIGHNTENALWAAMQKRPEITSTDEVFDSYHNRKQKEMEMDRPDMVNIVPETRFMPSRLIDKYIDRNGLQYRNPNSMEGEAEYYGDLGEEYYKIPKGQNGQEMKYYQEGLDWKPKTISKEGSVIKDNRGQWAHPGEITEISSNNITMQGVPYPVLGISDEGDTKLMKPGKNYKFKGKKVTEFPMAKNGVNQQDEKTLQHLDQLTNFTNYNKPSGWMDKYK